VDQVVEQRAQDATADAVSQMAKAEAQLKVAQASVQRAEGETAEARRKADEQLARATEAQDAAKDLQRMVEEERAVPPYWTNQAPGSASARVHMWEPMRIGTQAAETMMRQSILPGHDDGCRGFFAHSLRNFRVTRLERVENMTLWLNYQRQKTALRERMREHGHEPERLQTRYLAGERIMDEEINEFGLWHGTKPEIADILATSGFDERVGGDTNGGLYGQGSYFADAFCKADQYARQTNAADEYCVLYCRVTMGSPHRAAGSHVGDRRPPDNPATPGAPFDSIFAETGISQAPAGHGTQAHNEFVVFRHDQVYPEYIVWYTAG
jgi:hypothetical protein